MAKHFFDIEGENAKSTAHTWRSILEAEKNCDFETITAAELLASKLLYFIGS